MTSPRSPTRASPSGSSRAPFSPLGQDTHVATQERDLHGAADRPADRADAQHAGDARDEPGTGRSMPIYNYAVVTDAVEGLILVNVDTLADGEFRNNFLQARGDLEPGRCARRARGTSRWRAISPISRPMPGWSWSISPIRSTRKLAAVRPLRRCAGERDPVPLSVGDRSPTGVKLFDVTNLRDPVRGAVGHGAAGRCAAALCRAHLCLCRGQARRAGDRRRDPARERRRSTRR